MFVNPFVISRKTYPRPYIAYILGSHQKSMPVCPFVCPFVCPSAWPSVAGNLTSKLLDQIKWNFLCIFRICLSSFELKMRKIGSDTNKLWTDEYTVFLVLEYSRIIQTIRSHKLPPNFSINTGLCLCQKMILQNYPLNICHIWKGC